VQVHRFLKSRWDRRLSARYCEWLENFPRRVVCSYETDEPPFSRSGNYPAAGRS
jgi:hypothetical protein